MAAADGGFGAYSIALLIVRASAALAASNRFENFLISMLLHGGPSGPFNNANTLRTGQHGRAREADKQAMLDYARNRIQ